MSVAVYYPSWSAPWTDAGAKMDLVSLKNVTIVNLVFAHPNCTYQKGSLSWAGTGLEFSMDFKVVATAIALLKQKGVKVMLSVGGGSYWSTPQPFQSQACLDLMTDLGCDGIDLDWEVGTSDAASLTKAILSLKGKCLISFAGFSTGAYGPDGSQYMGMNIDAMEKAGGAVDWINIMVGATLYVVL
jgi:GH18 family chitinase